MHRFVVAVLVIAALATAQRSAAQQAFHVRSIRHPGTVLAATRTVGDWLAVGGYSIEAHGGELQHRAVSAHVSFGSVGRAGERFDVVTGGADVAIGFGTLPLMLTLGAEIGRATVEEDVTVTALRVPLHLANSAVLVFNGFWVHPIISAGAVFKRLDTDESSGGVEGSSVAGLEIGTGRVSLRGSLHHELTARQHGMIALRLRL